MATCPSGGSRWENKYERANVAFLIITILALSGIFFRAFFVRRTSSTTRSFFRWFIVAIVIAIISLTWNCINTILFEECVTVKEIYLIFDLILLWFQYLADLLLLATFITLMVSHMTIAEVDKSRGTPNMAGLHYVLCRVLVLFWLFSLALHTALFVELITDTIVKTNDPLYNLARRISLVYDLLYFLVIVEVLIWGFVILSSKESRANQKITRILFLVVGISLLIPRVWIVVIDSIQNSDNYALIRDIQRNEVTLARQIFYYLCTIIAFAALLASIASMDRLQPQEEVPAIAMGNVYHRAAPEPIPYLPVPPEPHWKRNSYKDRSQDPIYCGPEMVNV